MLGVDYLLFVIVRILFSGGDRMEEWKLELLSIGLWFGIDSIWEVLWGCESLKDLELVD